jgi:DNA-directed RNA polymerase subunit beta
MQSLALDVNVVSEEGQRTEMRDEDDDLLRAAEELGIDLSGVRATQSEAADEQAEKTDDTDAGPADEGEGEQNAPEDLDDADVDMDADIDLGDVPAEETEA